MLDDRRAVVVKPFPSIPDVEAAPASLLDGGHLWLQELVDGALVRFQFQASGMLRFGNRERVFSADEIPAPCRHAVRHLRENVDRAALRAAVDDVESVVFFGVATHEHAVDYDWERTPSFLGHDVWFADDERFLPPDAVEKIYHRLGLHPVNAFQKEVRAVDFAPDSYDIPGSNWYDGPAAGVVVRNKRGVRAALANPDLLVSDEPETTENASGPADDPKAVGASGADDVPELVDASAAELARRYATDRRFQRVADELEATHQSVTADAVFERVFECVVREEHRQLFLGHHDLDEGAFRSELASLTQQFVANRD